MEEFNRIEEILSDYIGRGQEFKATVDMLCSKGIANGCFKDYAILTDVLEILSICETIIGA
jgi:hypothetical protein